MIADKGLNSSKNIDAIVNHSDGFVFSHILKGKKGQRYNEKLFDKSGRKGVSAERIARALVVATCQVL